MPLRDLDLVLGEEGTQGFWGKSYTGERKTGGFQQN